MASKGTETMETAARVSVASPEGASIPSETVNEDFAVIQDWLTNYVSRPNPELGRKGPVCPFIPPALRADAVEYSFRYDLDGSHESAIYDALLKEFDDFDATAEPVRLSRTSLASRLVVMPRADESCWDSIDDFYEKLKDAAVARGLMTAQFHPNCDVRAVRNEGFKVARSPMAAIAIRRMAPHDILFLDGSPERFHEYERRFNHHYQHGRIHDPLLMEKYATTHAKYADASR
jgi:hypothetical protein